MLLRSLPSTSTWSMTLKDAVEAAVGAAIVLEEQ
jgi:hypothetical protein